MRRYLIESWLLLLRFEFVMRLRGFRSLHEMVRGQKVRAANATERPSCETLCRAVDLACVFYFKRVLCLQRSATTVVLLRRYGWRAELAIGTRLVPFQSHAWVEVEGTIVNDRPYLLDIYQVLERC
ncbi:MAG: lasso peptide biosynthesis B2 protein [Edaphobacter sp.]